MAPTGINCNRCGNQGFLTQARLRRHQRSSCYRPNQKEAINVSNKPRVTAEGEAEGHATAQDAHLNVLRSAQVVGPQEPDDVLFLDSVMQEQTYDSTFALVSWFRRCNNGQGLSTESIQSLLDLLIDPRFDLKKVTTRSAEDVARYLYTHEHGEVIDHDEELC